ncbi:nucleotidyltransferase domain-containing protein [Streptacidiphilus jiangxiensis]|uniref:Lincosamide nucleotidyltransferase A/C/D/E n=1 Tax=Streptacidiphilus jiangxiensis TaxID=235985 RepID=A0A1H7TQU3_STRJI|nr:aminoglycoside nucleotidyltransferase [Streptacidiphilus jiangxiensis]SEL86726.1 lincosamide nucleotidyltransferase A/C/D/E [Streptacidiphilus jiangxiensis]
MRVEDVLALYTDLDAAGVPVRIDGGWCVDALLGRETRPHPDLDLAVPREHVSALVALLSTQGFAPRGEVGATESNFVLDDGRGRAVDVHVFAFDADGAHVWGVAYPAASLTGTGVLAGQEVRCIAPEWMFRFKTAYPPAPKDRGDVRALAERFGYEIPQSHR